MSTTWCVPFALAFVSGATPAEVESIIQMDRGTSRPVRGVRRSEYIPLLKELGVSITATVDRPGATFRKWAANRAKWGDKSTWLIRKSGHLFVYRDGLMYDNTHPAGQPAESSTMRNVRVCVAWQVSA
jgi:hypothetical protein